MGLLKTAYFGGSFDPPHNGHVAIARAVLERGLAAEVWLAPALVAPHKEGTATLFSDRLRMVELAVAGIEGVTPCGVEGELGISPSYTFEVLSALKRRHPEREFALLIGGDMLESLHLWYRAEELVRDFEIISFPRRSSAVTPEALRRNWSDNIAAKLYGGLMTEMDFFDISSTNIRKIVEKSDDASNFIAKSVYEYIIKRGLYRDGEKG